MHDIAGIHLLPCHQFAAFYEVSPVFIVSDKAETPV